MAARGNGFLAAAVVDGRQPRTSLLFCFPRRTIATALHEVMRAAHLKKTEDDSPAQSGSSAGIDGIFYLPLLIFFNSYMNNFFIYKTAQLTLRHKCSNAIQESQ